jgi:hypothetical protein
MTIELEPGLADRVMRAAEAQGTDPNALAARKLDEAFPEDPMKRVLWNGMTVEQWIRETREWSARHKDWPVLPDEAFDRESIYADHD